MKRRSVLGSGVSRRLGSIDEDEGSGEVIGLSRRLRIAGRDLLQPTQTANGP